MLFENSGTILKRQRANTPPEIDKYGTYKNWNFTKMTHIAERFLKVTGISRVIFKSKLLNLLYDSDS